MEPGSHLIARLRVGSVLTTRGGATYRVLGAIVQVAQNGGVVPALMLEKTAPGRTPQSVLMPVGILKNLMRRGGRHKPGPGAAIDWLHLKPQALAKDTTFLVGRR